MCGGNWANNEDGDNENEEVEEEPEFAVWEP